MRWNIQSLFHLIYINFWLKTPHLWTNTQLPRISTFLIQLLVCVYQNMSMISKCILQYLQNQQMESCTKISKGRRRCVWRPWCRCWPLRKVGTDENRTGGHRLVTHQRTLDTNRPIRRAAARVLQPPEGELLSIKKDIHHSVLSNELVVSRDGNKSPKWKQHGLGENSWMHVEQGAPQEWDVGL